MRKQIRILLRKFTTLILNLKHFLYTIKRLYFYTFLYHLLIINSRDLRLLCSYTYLLFVGTHGAIYKFSYLVSLASKSTVNFVGYSDTMCYSKYTFFKRLLKYNRTIYIFNHRIYCFATQLT